MNKPSMASHRTDTTGLVLSGGMAKRMQGRDKGWVKLNDLPLITHTIERVRPQVSSLVINANRNLNDYRRLGFPVCTDLRTGFLGPLAGIEAGLPQISTPWALITPCDAPFLPLDLSFKLHQCAEQTKASIVVAKSGGFVQPTFLLLKCELGPSLSAFLDQGEGKIMLWVRQHAWAACDFANAEAFANLNSPEDIAHWQA